MRFLQKGQAEIVILILVAALAFILVDVLSFMSQDNLPKPIAQTVIKFSPEQQRVAKGSTNQADVTIDTGADKVTMVDLEYAFNPKAVNIVDITPGDFFDNPTVLKRDINNTNGRLSYLLEVRTEAHGIQGPGTLATITYRVIPGNPFTHASITSMPLTTVVDPRVHQSVVKESGSLFLYFN